MRCYGVSVAYVFDKSTVHVDILCLAINAGSTLLDCCLTMAIFSVYYDAVIAVEDTMRYV